MELTPIENVILERFYEKCRLAGGVRPGYMLRRDAIAYYGHEHPELDYDEGLSSLVERNLLKVNEGGNLFYLSGTGAVHLGAEAAGEPAT